MVRARRGSPFNAAALVQGHAAVHRWAIALNNVAFFDRGWVASVGVDAGVEWQLGKSANLAVQVSADYHGDLKDDDSDIGAWGLGSINDSGSRCLLGTRSLRPKRGSWKTAVVPADRTWARDGIGRSVRSDRNKPANTVPNRPRFRPDQRF